MNEYTTLIWDIEQNLKRINELENDKKSKTETTISRPLVNKLYVWQLAKLGHWSLSLKYIKNEIQVIVLT